jgi:ribosomal protein S27AE
MLPCPYHDETVACDRCPQRYATDRAGFPHPKDTVGLEQKRHCPACGVLVTRAMFDVGRWLCGWCIAEDREAPGAPIANASGQPPRA